MSKIIWLASYPKSGNTWVRFLLANLIFGSVDSAATLARMIPDIHELGDVPEPPLQPTVMKTHYVNTLGLPLRTHTAGAIYIVRDPADVMLSNYHYAKRSGGGVVDDDARHFDAYVEAFIQQGGEPRWRTLGMGRWDEHVRSWLRSDAGFPVLRVRYEDLLTDGAAWAAQLCRALGVKRTPEQVRSALDAASFDSMRRIEESDIGARRVGVFYKPYLQTAIDAGLRFMRSGKSGEAVRRLSPDQWRRFDDVFGALRAELGYPRVLT